jgi:hypothetical protein
MHSLTDLSGKTTVLVFFPLVSRNPRPMAMWNADVEHFAGKPVQFVLITSEKESSLLPWLAQHPVSGSLLYDSDGETGRAYGSEMPDMVYIGADRKIVGFQQGIVPDDRTLTAVLEGHITTTRPKLDLASIKAFDRSGLVPLDAESPRMPRPGRGRTHTVVHILRPIQRVRPPSSRTRLLILQNIILPSVDYSTDGMLSLA